MQQSFICKCMCAGSLARAGVLHGSCHAAAFRVTSAWVKMFSIPRIPFLGAESTSLFSTRKDDLKRSL